MNVLVDTSIWVRHFRQRDDHLTHPMVVAELACGTPPVPREQTLSSLQRLRKCNQVELDEVTAFIEREKLYGQGCGLVDLILLASALITEGARLWTLDKRLANLADRFEIGYPTGSS